MYIGLIYDILSRCAYVAPFHLDALCYIHVMLCYNVTLPYSALWGVTKNTKTPKLFLGLII